MFEVMVILLRHNRKIELRTEEPIIPSQEPIPATQRHICHKVRKAQQSSRHNMQA